MSFKDRLKRFFSPKSKKSSYKYYSTLPSLKNSTILDNEMLELLGNIDIDSASNKIIKQARNLSLSNSLISGYFATMISEILGENGVSLDMHTEDASLNKSIENDFKKFKNTISNDLDFYDLEELVLLCLLRDGEAFVYIKEASEFSFYCIDPLNVDASYTDEFAKIYYGIEFDNYQNPIAYHIKDDRGKLTRIPATSVLHIYKKHYPTQIRGLSNLAPVIVPAHLNGSFKSSELKRARLQGEITGFFTKEEGFESLSIDDGQDNPNKNAKIEQVSVGKMQYIDDNVKPHFVESHNPTNIEFFIKDNKREIAKALGVSYSTLTGDLTDVNYSSIRHGGNEQKRQFKRLQNLLIRKLHIPLFERWIKNQLKQGIYKASKYESIINNYTFKAQGWEYIDPYKEMNANKIALQTGQKTLSQILRSNGKELDTHIEELKKDEEVYQLLNKITNKGFTK